MISLMELVLGVGGTKENMFMESENLVKIACEEFGQKELSALKEVDIHKFEDAIERDSEEVIRMSKRLFWNNVIVIGFMLQGLLYVWLTRFPQKPMIWMSIIAILIASTERLYIHKKIKNTLQRLAAFSMIIDFLKKVRNENICSR